MSKTLQKIGMTPPHPGEFIRDEILDEFGLSITQAADLLDVRRATLSDVLHGRATLSPEMAFRIEKAFQVDMETLLRMQVWHDATKLRRRSKEIRVTRYHARRANQQTSR
jgi:addiction module HigA family antidote